MRLDAAETVLGFLVFDRIATAISKRILEEENGDGMRN
jgi:hypothetical protein